MILMFLLVRFFVSPVNYFNDVNASNFNINDTIINAVRISEEVKTNTWTIEWLKHFETLHITVTCTDGKKMIDQTFVNTDNGELHLIHLAPAFYFVTVQTDNELPNHTPILQRGLSTYKDEE